MALLAFRNDTSEIRSISTSLLLKSENSDTHWILLPINVYFLDGTP